jgi:GMP synthase (glutamine-hydrolysing)
MIVVFENEVDPDSRYFVPEIRRHLTEAGADVRVYSYAAEGGRSNATHGRSVPNGNRPRSLEDADGVVLSGSTAGVYETDRHPWMDDLREIVRDLVADEVPTLGICFGHQLVNDALGGRVEHRGLHAGIERIEFDDDPLFEGVAPRVPVIHGDFVTELAADVERVARADYYDNFASRHREAPLWTVQYHPEFTARLLASIESDFGWPEDAVDRDFADVTVERTFENFVRLVGGW